jgi:hypothetical protein
MQMAGGEQGAEDFHFCNSGVVANRLYCAEHHGPAYVQEAGRPADLRDALELLEAIKMQVRSFDPDLQTSWFSCQDSRKPRLPASSVMSSPPSPGPMVGPALNASLPMGLTVSWL